METVLGMDQSKVELLDQVLRDLEASFSDAPASVQELAKNALSAVRLLRNSLKFKFSEHVAQLARDGNPDAASEALLKLFPDLKDGNVKEILRLLYVDVKDLAGAIAFVEKIREEFRQVAYEALYENVRHEGHTEMPEILLLQRSMILADEGETMKQVDEDCNKIVDRIVEGVKTKNYELSKEIIRSCGSSILNGKMTSIVEKVHSAGTLEDTLLLIKFSQGLVSEISTQCTLIQVLLEVLNSKNFLQSIHGMHLWSHAMRVRMSDNFPTAGDQEKCLFACNELSKNKEVYFEIYRSYVENPDGNKIGALHQDVNRQIYTVCADFVLFYYDGDMKKASTLLVAARNSNNYQAAGCILGPLHKKMAELKQLGTVQVFEIFTMVKYYKSGGNYSEVKSSTKLLFEELQAKAPPCLRLLLWPEPAGAKFRLVNKFFNFPLSSSNTKVLCGLPADRKEEQMWSTEVDLETSLVTFTIQDGNLSSDLSDGTLCLAQDQSSKWRVKPVDEHHVKIFLQDAGNFNFFKINAYSFF